MALLFLARLKVAKHSFLTATPENQQSVARNQVTALGSMIKLIGSTLTPPEKVKIVQEVMSIDWNGAADPLLQSLMRDEKTKRGNMRDYTAFISYFTTEEWALLLSADCTMDGKLNVLIERLLELGGRFLSEHTKKLGGSLWIEVSGSRMLSEETKQILRTSFNTTLTRSLNNLNDPIVQYVILPSPAVFEREHPQLFNTIFPNSKPIPCKVDERTLMTQDAMVQCRNRRPQLADRSNSVLNLGDLGCGSSSGNLNNSNIDRMSNFVLQGMAQMQATQSKLVELMMGSGGPKSLKGLQSGVDLSPTALRTPPRRTLTMPGPLDGDQQPNSPEQLQIADGLEPITNVPPPLALVHSHQQLNARPIDGPPSSSAAIGLPSSEKKTTPRLYHESA